MRIIIQAETEAEKASNPNPIALVGVTDFAIGVNDSTIRPNDRRSFPTCVTGGDWWTVLHGIQEMELHHVANGQRIASENAARMQAEKAASDAKELRNAKGKGSIIERP